VTVKTTADREVLHDRLSAIESILPVRRPNNALRSPIPPAVQSGFLRRPFRRMWTSRDLAGRHLVEPLQNQRIEKIRKATIEIPPTTRMMSALSTPPGGG